MIKVLVHRDGVTRPAEAVDPAWLKPGAPEIFWVDMETPGEPERHLLSDVFHFHELAVEDAMATVHHPKIEAYENFLYLILHRMVQGAEGFQTEDVDFFLGSNFLVTVHADHSTSIDAEMTTCGRYNKILAEGVASLLHRLVDRMVDHYGPAVDGLEDRLEEVERCVFEEPQKNPLKSIMVLKRDIASLRRVALPQRDAVGRLARREFPEIPENLTYRFRDVYDHLVRLTDEAVFFQDRVTGLLDAFLSNQSNRLNQVMKVLTVISTIFMPLTVLTSMYGMNVHLPPFPGGDGAQFWWIVGLMALSSGFMLWAFRKVGWV